MSGVTDDTREGLDDHSDGSRARALSTEAFETVFEHASDAIFVVDVENDRVVECNGAAEDLVEYSRSELQSMPASDLHPHNLPAFRAFAQRVLEQGEGWTDEVTCYCKSGEIVPAEMSASVVELDGRSHIVNHVRERTDEDRRDWFEALLEHSSDLITVVKPDGTVRYQSPSIEPVLGYERGAVRGRDFFEFLHPDDKQEVRERVAEITGASSSVVTRMEFRFREADGSWAWLESIASYRPDASITGIVLNSRDVTARKENYQQAVVLNRVLRHNLRNGLNVILGYADRLTDADTPSITDNAERIRSTAEDLHDATTYVSDLSDILESHASQHRHDVAALVRATVRSLAEDHPNVTFDCDLPGELHVSAAPKLDVALDHVIRNAVEHNDATDPRVEVVVRPPTDGEYAEVVVADNGPGIPQQEREVLLRGEETPLKHSSGLGLWMLNWIITRSGGRIAVDENEPRGSRVTIELPTAE